MFMVYNHLTILTAIVFFACFSLPRRWRHLMSFDVMCNLPLGILTTPQSRDQSLDHTSCSRPILSYSHSDRPTNGQNLVHIPCDFCSDNTPIQLAQNTYNDTRSFISAISRWRRIGPSTVHSNTNCEFNSVFTFRFTFNCSPRWHFFQN